MPEPYTPFSAEVKARIDSATNGLSIGPPGANITMFEDENLHLAKAESVAKLGGYEVEFSEFRYCIANLDEYLRDKGIYFGYVELMQGSTRYTHIWVLKDRNGHFNRALSVNFSDRRIASPGVDFSAPFPSTISDDWLFEKLVQFLETVVRSIK